ncbi:MAG: hypothetical protein R3A11_02260 [Bdellovibrionota bacterium]
MFQSSGEYRLNNPVSTVMISGSNLAVTVNANITLNQSSGAIVGLDLSTDQVLTDTLLRIPSFGGRFFINPTNKNIYVPDRENNALLVYQYSVPGTGGLPISFSAVNVPSPISSNLANAIETDENPCSVLTAQSSIHGDLVLVANKLTGSITFIRESNLTAMDMNTDSQFNGKRLFTAANIGDSSNQFPARGLYRLVADSNSNLIYATSTTSNVVHVLDPNDLNVEAALDFSVIAGSTRDLRGITFDGAGKGFVVHRGLKSLIVFDSSVIVDNGIDMEVVVPTVLATIPLGNDPEDVVLDNGLLFVSHVGEESIYVINANNYQVQSKVYLSEGADPVDLFVDSPNNRFYSTNFFSDSISVFDLASFTFTKDIM